MSKKKGKKGKRRKRRSWNQRIFSLKIFFRDHNLILSSLLVALCLLFIVLGSLSLFIYPDNAASIPQPFRDWSSTLHGATSTDAPHYDLCLFPTGLLMLIIAGWYMGDGIYKRRKFAKMMETDSKAEFIENLDDLEKLAWQLGTKYEHQVVDMKEELGIIRKRR